MYRKSKIRFYRIYKRIIEGPRLCRWYFPGFLFLILLLSGCGGTFHFKTYHAKTYKDALEQFIDRRESLTGFQADCTFEIDFPKGEFAAHGDVLYTDNEGWRLTIKGPMGFPIADIETKGNRYSVRNMLKGATVEGALTDSLLIPELDFEFPQIRVLTEPLMPVVNLRKIDGWRITGEQETEDLCSVELIRAVDEDAETLYLTYQNSPLRVLSEDRYWNDEKLYSREFLYNSPESNIPVSIELTASGIFIAITYNSLKIETNNARGGAL